MRIFNFSENENLKTLVMATTSLQYSFSFPFWVVHDVWVVTNSARSPCAHKKKASVYATSEIWLSASCSSVKVFGLFISILLPGSVLWLIFSHILFMSYKFFLLKEVELIPMLRWRIPLSSEGFGLFTTPQGTFYTN